MKKMKNRKHSAKKGLSKKTRVVVLIICFVVVVMFATHLISFSITPPPQAEIVTPTPTPEDALASPLPSPDPPTPEPPTPSPPEPPPTPPPIEEFDVEPAMLEKFIELYEQNPDIIGWIRIPGTEVDYPVVQSPFSDWDYYLNRDFYGEHDLHGIPYIWPQHDIIEDDLIFIFGHNMRDGSRFADVINYFDYDFFEDHPVIEFYTLYEEGRFEVAFAFQVFVVENVNQYYYHPQRGTADQVEFPYTFVTSWEDEEAFWSFIEKNREHALYDTGVTVEYGNRIIALWTCLSRISRAHRLVVVAVEQSR